MALQVKDMKICPADIACCGPVLLFYLSGLSYNMMTSYMNRGGKRV